MKFSSYIQKLKRLFINLPLLIQKGDIISRNKSDPSLRKYHTREFYNNHQARVGTYFYKPISKIIKPDNE
jgi:hypothetical protein